MNDILHPQRSQFVRFLSRPESAINCYPRERRVACSTHAEDPFRRASGHAVPIYHSWRLFRNSARPMENFHRLAPRIPVPFEELATRCNSARSMVPFQRFFSSFAGGANPEWQLIPEDGNRVIGTSGVAGEKRAKHIIPRSASS